MARIIWLGILLCAAGIWAAAPDSTNGWGYGYGALLKDLEAWKANPFVRVDSIGASAEGRGLWMVTITDSNDSLGGAGHERKRRVFMHARTHPAEVQVNYVADEAIRFLLDTTAKAAELRRDFIFNIIPMYNPDGVEDGHARQNAHLVDIESNWDKPVLEPEVKVLKAEFQALMAGPIPIEVALNLHSDQFNCTRFFFFHEAAGTSEAYTVLEKDFIGKVQGYFTTGIENWSFVKSWADGTGLRYPEGFWWANHGAAVLALTYEDANCPGAAGFDSTARALVLGSVDYIRAHASATRPVASRGDFRLVERDGGWALLGPPIRGRMGWAMASADGKLLARGVLENGAAFIPAPAMPIRPAWLLLHLGTGLAPAAFALF
jgi:hypothetical protein